MEDAELLNADTYVFTQENAIIASGQLVDTAAYETTRALGFMKSGAPTSTRTSRWVVI